jgi:hypothetical protein
MRIVLTYLPYPMGSNPIPLQQHMSLDSFILYFLSTLLVFSSLLVICVSNTVYSVLFLILSFITSAGILFLLDCEFMALIFVVIYVGAIAILFFICSNDARHQNNRFFQGCFKILSNKHLFLRYIFRRTFVNTS